MRVLAWMVIGCLLGCGPGVTTGPRDGYEPEQEAERARQEPAQPGPRAGGAVSRAAMIEVLDAGPGAFLAGIEMNAHFRDKRFDGWEIVRFWPGDARYAAVDVRPGDIIASVNGQGLQRPENLFEVWTALREADEIVVSGVRGGAPFELRFAIEGAAPRPPPGPE